MEITVKQLVNLNACEKGIQWFISQKKCKLKPIINALLKDNHFDYASWLLSRLLTCRQNTLWAIMCAKSTLNNFESRFPYDNRPRFAIKAAEDFLSAESNSNYSFIRVDAYAADYAIDDDAAAAAYAAYAAAYATYTAEVATDDATYAACTANAASYASDAAYTANAAAYASDAASDDASYANKKRKQKEIKICNFALKILGEIK